MHTCIHAHIHTYIGGHELVRGKASVLIHTYIHMHIHAYIHTNTSTYIG